LHVRFSHVSLLVTTVVFQYLYSGLIHNNSMQGFVSFTLNCLKAHTLSHRITKDTNEFSGYVTSFVKFYSLFAGCASFLHEKHHNRTRVSCFNVGVWNLPVHAGGRENTSWTCLSATPISASLKPERMMHVSLQTSLAI